MSMFLYILLSLKNSFDVSYVIMSPYSQGKSELKREKEFATLKNKHWEELHTKDASDIEKLTLSLDVKKEKEESLSRELEVVREKARVLGHKEVELNAVITEQKSRVETTESLLTKLQEELQEVKLKYAQLSDNYEYLENSSKDQITKASEHMQGLQAEMAVVRANLQAEFIVTQEASEQNFHIKNEAFQNQVQEYKHKLDSKERECQELSKALDDERAEGDAMRLRLTLHATTNANPVNTDAPNQRSGSDNIPRLNTSQSHLQAAASPMFSEDFGSVSIPSSPMNFKSPYYQVRYTLLYLRVSPLMYFIPHEAGRRRPRVEWWCISPRVRVTCTEKRVTSILAILRLKEIKG